MTQEICTVDLSKGMLDNEYTFYDDGRIRHFYDQSQYKFNQEKWINDDDLSDSEKGKIIAKCPEGHEETIRKIIYK